VAGFKYDPEDDGAMDEQAPTKEDDKITEEDETPTSSFPVSRKNADILVFMVGYGIQPLMQRTDKPPVSPPVDSIKGDP
jgi:hypothetical protein